MCSCINDYSSTMSEKCNSETRRNAIPILYTRGTYYEVGFDVGRTFRGLIEDHLAMYRPLHKLLLPAYETSKGREAYESTLKNLETNFPHYVRELKGVSDGARVPLHHLMLIHMDAVIYKSAGIDYEALNGCSSVCFTNDQQVILGHTEDALPETLNHIYVVSAHIIEDTPQGKWKTKEEGFTALCYAGFLPGFCMGYNHHGLVFSINILFPTETAPGKTPPYFLTRALLSAETMKQAQSILCDRGVGAADGFSVNMSFTQQEGDHLFHNAEIGPAVGLDESQMSVLTISPGEHHVHANKYLRLNIPEGDEETKSSNSRLARVSKCSPLDSRDAVLSFLSNTEDVDYPVFRGGGHEDPIKTVTVGVFDLLEKTWTLWMKNPSTADPIATLPMLFKWSNNENY